MNTTGIAHSKKWLFIRFHQQLFNISTSKSDQEYLLFLV